MLGVQSCKMGPKYERPEVVQPEGYLYDSIKHDTIVNLRWWELFNDTTLQRLIEVGLKENLDVLTATSRIEQAEATYGMSRSDLWPKFGYFGTGSRYNMPALQNLGVEPMFNLFQAKATVSWELDFWGKIRRMNEAGKAQVLASESAQRAVMMTLIAGIAETYFKMLDFKQRLEIAKVTYNSRLKSLELMQLMFDHGTISELELNQSQIQLASAEAALPQFERAYKVTQNALSVLIGKTPRNIKAGMTLDQQQTPPEIPIGIPSQLLARRPDVLMSEYTMVAQNAAIGVAVAMRFPSFALTGSGGVLALAPGKLLTNPLAWNIGGAFVGPLFNFGKNKRRVEVERKKTEQTAYAYKKTVLNAFRGVEDALIGIKTYKAELSARKKQVKAATNALRLAEARYKGGVTSYLEVLEQQKLLFQSQIGESQTHQAFLTSYVTLYKELGGGWISSEEEEENKK